MFRTGLLVSTAMTAVTLLLSGAPAYPQTDMHVASHDPNMRFLCTYGQFFVSASSHNSNSGEAGGSAWEHVAVAVTGHGQTVSRIRVIEAQASNTSRSAFSVGIYSNSPSGFPGNPIASGKGKAGPTCGPVGISIPPTTLKTNKKYWIEETASTGRRCRRTCHRTAGFYWEADPATKSKVYVQHHHKSSSSGVVDSSYTTPWTKQTTGPYFRLR